MLVNATRLSSNSNALKVEGSKIACLNVTSLPKHIDEIRLLLYWIENSRFLLSTKQDLMTQFTLL